MLWKENRKFYLAKLWTLFSKRRGKGGVSNTRWIDFQRKGNGFLKEYFVYLVSVCLLFKVCFLTIFFLSSQVGGHSNYANFAFVKILRRYWKSEQTSLRIEMKFRHCFSPLCRFKILMAISCQLLPYISHLLKKTHDYVKKKNRVDKIERK